MSGKLSPPDTVKRWRTSVLQVVLNLLFSILIRRQHIGLGNIPADGGCVLIFNHLSNFDSPILFSAIRRSKITGLVAEEYRERPFHRFFIETMGGRWIKRGESDRAALKQALQLLEDGWLIGISPEGTRSPTKALIDGKHGTAFLATRVRVPVLPVALTGTEQIGASLKRLRRATVTIRFGEPFHLPTPGRVSTKQHIQLCTDLMMEKLAALLPPEYRGVYDNSSSVDPPPSSNAHES